jgi:uncharacterized protein YndB with AHSA1/START domain
MKFILELPINKPRIEVWKFFTDTEKAKLWQTSLQRVETLSGMVGTPGAELKWTYEERGREFSLIEKILQCEEPAQFESQFENEFATNIVNNRFVEQAENETLWTMETTYRFKTLLMKITGPLLKKNYVARSQRDMEQFKEAVEKE